MEHEEEEAVKALETAEELFKAHDFRGARMMAHKAQLLFPSLPGVDNVLMAYRVHVDAARKSPSGDTDWHAVLGVPPSSDSEVIKGKYVKLRHILVHADNCKSVAAEGAFLLVEQAWRCINSSPRAASGSTPNSETHNTTSHSRSPQVPPARSGDAKVKPGAKNSEGRLVQAEVDFKAGAAVDNSKGQSCHGSTVIPPRNKFAGSKQQEDDLPPQHRPPSPPPPPPPPLSSSQSSIANFLLCPFCGARNSSYRVIDGHCHIACQQCGVPSSIRKNGASLDKSDQVSGAPPPGSLTGIAMARCRKCRTPYDGKIPNNRRILRKCKLCGSWASIKLEIKQIRVHEDQQRTPAADPPNQTTIVVSDSDDEPSDSPTASELVRGPPGGRASKYLSKEN